MSVEQLETVEAVETVEDSEASTLEKKKMYRKAYYQANKEKYKNNYAKNKDLVLEKQKKRYRDNNPIKKKIFIRVDEENINNIVDSLINCDDLNKESINNILTNFLINI